MAQERWFNTTTSRNEMLGASNMLRRLAIYPAPSPTQQVCCSSLEIQDRTKVQCWCS